MPRTSSAAPVRRRFAPGPALSLARLAVFTAALAAALAASAAVPSSALAAYVYIDPGHGGRYSNANANGLREKNVNLAIAKALREELQDRGHKVGMTRTTDRAVSLKDRATWNWSDSNGWRYAFDGKTRYSDGVPKDDLQARCDKANAAGADIFISIHNNGASSRSAHGTETWASREDPLGQKLSDLVQEEVVKATGLTDRGAFEADYYVLRWSNMPAVLVEGGFITNPTEAAKLGNASFRRKMARGIARGVARFLDSQPFRAAYPRVAGADRYGTAAAVSRTGWPSGAGTVLLASGLNWPDAMSAAPLSRKLDAPLLLTPPQSLDPVAAAEIARLKPENIVVLGGPDAVDPAVVAKASQVASIAPEAVRRIGGRDRYETAARIAQEVGMAGGRAVLVNGTALVDALSIVPQASTRQWPILLTARDELPQATRAFFTGSVPATATTLVVGGPAVVGAGAYGGLPSVKRVWGADRYRTNAEVLRWFYPTGVVAPFVVNGNGPYDALVGSTLAAKVNQPLLLTGGRFISGYTREWITRNRSRIGGYTIVGGTGVMPYVCDWMLVKATKS